MFKLSCYFPADEPIFFAINIDSACWVSELLKAIQLELRSYGREVSRKDLQVFKADIPLQPLNELLSHALQWLHEQPLSSHLPAMKKLVSLFPNGPCLSDDLLDIVIADPEVLELVEGLGDPDDTYKRKVRKALNMRLDHFNTGPSPSDTVHSSQKLAELFGGKEPAIHLGRPGGPPVVIFNPSLAKLQQCLSHPEQVQVFRIEVEHADKYLDCANIFHKDKAQHQTAIEGLVNQAIGAPGKWNTALSWADGIKPDSSWWYDEFLILVLELKNNLGLSGDALLQAIVDYSKIILQERVRH